MIGNKDLILNHGGNLRIDQISELVKDFSIEDFINKIVRNYGLKSYFLQRGIHSEDTYNRTISQNPKNLFEELEWLVAVRNDVAHGWVGERVELVLRLGRRVRDSGNGKILPPCADRGRISPSRGSGFRAFWKGSF